MRNVHAHGLATRHTECSDDGRTAPTCLAIGTFAGWSSACRCIAPSIFLDPFAPPAQRKNTARLQRYYESSDSCSAALRIHTAAVAPPEPPSRTMNTDLFRTGLSASCIPTSDRSSSNHPLPPRTLASLRFTFWLNHGSSCHPSSITHRVTLWHIDFAVAESARRDKEPNPALNWKGALSFRTNRSPPDAPHPASQRRSSGQLQDQTPTS